MWTFGITPQLLLDVTNCLRSELSYVYLSNSERMLLSESCPICLADHTSLAPYLNFFPFQKKHTPRSSLYLQYSLHIVLHILSDIYICNVSLCKVAYLLFQTLQHMGKFFSFCGIVWMCSGYFLSHRVVAYFYICKLCTTLWTLWTILIDPTVPILDHSLHFRQN